jgi:hypothetical protein
MRDLILLFVHVLATSIRLARPGGVRSVLAESVLLKHQLVILNRSRRAPNLRASDRLITGLCALLILPRRLVRSAVVVKPSTLLNFQRALVHRKYRLLFSPKHRAKPGPKGPSPDLIRAVIEMKQRNPRWGCPRIAEQIGLAFGELLTSSGMKPTRTSAASPWQNGIAERWIGSCRRELLDHVIVLNDSHLRRLIRDYISYYHADRIHDSLEKDTPTIRPVSFKPGQNARLVSSPRIGGLHHRYDWQQAT